MAYRDVELGLDTRKIISDIQVVQGTDSGRGMLGVLERQLDCVGVRHWTPPSSLYSAIDSLDGRSLALTGEGADHSQITSGTTPPHTCYKRRVYAMAMGSSSHTFCATFR